MRGGGNMQQMMKQMQKMQKKMAQEQEKLKEERKGSFLICLRFLFPGKWMVF